MKQRKEIWWCAKEPGKHGTLLPWTSMCQRKLAIAEFERWICGDWRTHRKEGFRIVKIQVREIKP